MRPPLSTNVPGRSRWLSAWKAAAGRPATGTSFLVILVLASLAALAVTIWAFYSAGKTPRDGAAAAGFKI